MKKSVLFIAFMLFVAAVAVYKALPRLQGSMNLLREEESAQPAPRATPTQTAEEDRGAAGLSGLRVAVDPGHGGIDRGAVGARTGVCESDLSLQIARLVAAQFERAGSSVLLTRTSDDVDYSGEGETQKLKDMNNRARAVTAFEPDVLISIHMNIFTDPSVRGAEVFCQEGNDQSMLLAQTLQQALNRDINGERARKQHAGDYFILQVIDGPSVIVECGYLSNPGEERLLQDPAHQEKLAACIVDGVRDYFGFGE